ncbi:MFS-type transporter SLC18B1-like [Pollicipes pollicipes]|uniref:MFS-type transporter SLC18B1-like n=1 Tax=Pollicipes pollicipes TaxID=41117 RepID=UPI0018850302|nr:MFS-type transporter SLC18B1-like [Pollicipes pollicipes]
MPGARETEVLVPDGTGGRRPSGYGACPDDDLGSQADTESGSSSEDPYYKPESDQEYVTKRRKPKFTWRQLVFLGALASITMTSSLSLCIFPPFFPKVAESKGFSASVYGAIIGTNCFVSFVVTPFLGKHIETIGLSFTLVSGVLASGVSGVLCGMLDMFPAGMPFVYTAVAIRAVQSIGNAGIIITTFTYTNLQFPTSTGIIFAMNRTVMSVAQMFGPALGGVFYELGGYCAPFVVFGVLHMVTLVPLLCVLPGSMRRKSSSCPADRDADKQTVSVWRMVHIPGIWVAFVSFFVATMSTGFLSVTLEAQILRKYNLSHILLGLMFGLKDGASSLASPIWGLLCDKFSCIKAYIVATSLTAAACFALFGPLLNLPIHQTLWMVVVSLCLYGMSIGGMQVAGVVDALREAVGGGLHDDATTHAVVAGMWSSLSGAGRFISRCGAGILVDTIGFPLASSVIVLLHMGMALLASVYMCLSDGGGRGRADKPVRRRLLSAPDSSPERHCSCLARAAATAARVPVNYLTHSMPDCGGAGSYNALMGE